MIKAKTKGKKEDDKDVTVLETPEINNLKMEEVDILKSGVDEEMELEAEVISVVLPLEVYHKLMAYTKLLDVEINGLGLVEKVDETTFKITEIFLLDQVVSGAACEIDKGAIEGLMDKLIKEEKNPSMLRFWWHSHNSMGVAWSGTDDTTGKKYAGSEYLISIVTNHRGQMRAKMNIYQPVEMAIDNIGIVIEQPQYSEALIEDCEKEINEKVKQTKTTVHHWGAYGYGVGNHYGNNDNIKQFNQHELEEDDKNIEGGPWGDSFVDGEVRVTWNTVTQRYHFCDVKSKRTVSDDEALMLSASGYDYNQEMDLNSDVPTNPDFDKRGK